MLGRQAVVDARDHAAGRVGERPADAVVRVDVADHPAAAVEEDEAGKGPRPDGV